MVDNPTTKPDNEKHTPPSQLSSDDDSTMDQKHIQIDEDDDQIKVVQKQEQSEKPSFEVQQSNAQPSDLNLPNPPNNNNRLSATPLASPRRVSLDVPQSPRSLGGRVVIPTPRPSTDPATGLRRSISTVISVYAPLPFHLREHKLAVALVTAVIVIDHGVLPPVLYFALKYGTTLRDQAIFGIVTSVFGVVFGIDQVWRLYKLWRKDGAYRPEGMWRWGVDYFQISFCNMLLINVIFIVTGTSINPPLMRMLALPMPLIIIQFAWQLLLSQLLRHLDVRAPFRMSSVQKGEKFPLVLYLIIEDVIAVDGNGKNEWRRAWRKRYENSRDMRMIVEKMSLFWGVGSLIAGAVCIVLIFAVDGKIGREAGYTLGWLAPWLWVIPAAAFTTYYVKRSLKEEKDFPIEVVEVQDDLGSGRDEV